MQEAPCLLLLLALGQRRVDDEDTKPLAAPSVMKSSEKDSTTKTTTKSTMSMTTLAKNAGAAADGDGCTKTTTVCAARTGYPRRPG